ncbi:DgaE family pyridoxal phosphate-dependent ammonia lyase [Brevibacillus centrosporus]|uniref:DgaE family pyridoxal phosphate-dependent ammonia lyase n=1 Tax=Brevibacillus centrosporus TaxID=54910 RepID=UPI003987A66B
MGIYQKLGLKQVINASGKMTALGASAVAPSVAQAMGDAAMDYVEMSELMLAAGQHIAAATGAEDGCPTSGAAAGIAISVAAVITGTHLSLIEKLPCSEGLKNKIVIQKGHAVHFGAPVQQMIALGGGRAVEAGSANHVEEAHLREAIDEQTAALLYVKSHHAIQKGMQSLETMIRIGREQGIPVIVDAAAEEDLRHYLAKGADLVIYSGGKAVGGPTSGFIAGRAPLIAACRAQYKGIGRAMKVGKEAIVGLLTALQQYDPENQDASWQRTRVEWLAGELGSIAGVTANIVQDEAGRAIYRVQVRMDEQVTGRTAQELVRLLEQGDPAIFTRNHAINTDVFAFDPRPFHAGQEKIIAARMKELLEKRKEGE